MPAVAAVDPDPEHPVHPDFCIWLIEQRDLLDKRGTGLSDPVAAPAPLEDRMDDVRAVMDAAGSERAALLGLSEGGAMSVLFAATYPERTRALILCGTFATGTLDPDDNPVGQRWVPKLLDLRPPPFVAFTKP